MTESMKALVKDEGRLSIRAVPVPAVLQDKDVLVRVEMAGLCRTDIYVAEDVFKTSSPLVLGHEFSGFVEAAGDDGAGRFEVGSRVTINPLLHCGCCSSCRVGLTMACQDGDFLGIDKDGCFAGWIKVPVDAVHVIPDSMSLECAAFSEPVAASLAVFKAGIDTDEKGLILGGNRFSRLLESIMRFRGYENLTVAAPEEVDDLEASSFDYVIETKVFPGLIDAMVRAVRPGGKIILKSRDFRPASFLPYTAIKKEPVLHIVNYGSFEEALEILASGALGISDLIEGFYDLDQYPSVFERSRSDESLKPLFAPWRS